MSKHQPNLKHGFCGTRFYRIWKGIKTRIYIKSDKGYRFYGAKGIKTDWDNFEDFKKDMYKSYLIHVKKYGEKQTTIDRIDTNGNYCKKNCRWATWDEQFKNRPQTKIYSLNGVEKTLKEWAEFKKVNLKSLRWQIYKGSKLLEALTSAAVTQ